MANGDLIKLGTFYLGGIKQPRPTRPWRNDMPAPGTSLNGDIPSFNNGQTIEIRNTDTNDAYKINWREVNDGNKKLLISDRVLLVSVPWNALNAQGLIAGKTITIDNQQYKLRILTGGSDYRVQNDSYAGGTPTSNEWDRIIVNEANFNGLPIPTASDLNNTTDYQDLAGAHNQFWNWVYANSWTQEVASFNANLRSIRGGSSARYFAFEYADTARQNIGWRPVLEVLNTNPSITLANPANNQAFVKGSDINFQWTGNDSDGDVLNYTLQIGTSTGASNIYNSGLGTATSKNGISAGWALGTYYWRVIADDGKGGITTSAERTFVINNTLPTVTVTAPANSQSFIKGTDINFVWSGSDPDGDSLTYTLQVGTSSGGSNLYNSNLGSSTSKSGISASWGLGTYYWRVIVTDTKGGSVTSVERTFVISNAVPTLTLTSPTDNQTLSEGNTMTVQGSVTDADANDPVTIYLQINNGTILAVDSKVSDGATAIPFAKILTYKNKRVFSGTTDLVGVDLAENTDHTLKVWAEDNKQGKSTEAIRKFRIIWNRPPVIDGENKDLGSFIQPPVVNYSATDPEGNTFTFSEYLNGKQIRSFAGVAGQQYTVEIIHDAWIRLDLDVQHQIKIVATDSSGISSERIYTFTRTETHIEFMLDYGNPDIKADFMLDGMPLRVLVTLERYLPEGSSIESVKVCNNYLDAVPTWEDCTGAVKGNRGYLFTNKTKTAANWAINLWVIIAKGTATERVRLNGYGGAFD